MNSHFAFGHREWRHQLPILSSTLNSMSLSLLMSTSTAQLPHLRLASCTYIRNNSLANKCQKCFEKIILCRAPGPLRVPYTSPLPHQLRHSEGDATAQTFSSPKTLMGKQRLAATPSLSPSPTATAIQS